MADLQLTNTNEAIRQLEIAVRTFQRQWSDTQAVWHDPVSQHFEKSVQAPLTDQSATVLKQMQNLAQTLENARRSIPPVRRAR